MRRNNLLLLLAGACLAACSEVTLTPTPEKATVSLQLEWGEETASRSMKAYFYPTESTPGTSGLPVFLEGNGNELTGEMPEGTYRVITYNTNVTGLTFDRMSAYGTATVSAEPVTTRAGGMMVAQPSAFYSCALPEEVTTSLLDPLRVTAWPRQLTRNLKLKIELSDIRGVDALTGTLCGIYPSLLLSTGKPSAESVALAPTVKSSFRVDNPTKKVEINLRTLGVLNPEGGDNYRSLMELVLLGNDGWQQEATVDMTEVLTDIFSQNKDDLPIETPVEVEVIITPVGMSLEASVKSWVQGNGNGYIYE